MEYIGRVKALLDKLLALARTGAEDPCCYDVLHMQRTLLEVTTLPSPPNSGLDQRYGALAARPLRIGGGFRRGGCQSCAREAAALLPFLFRARTIMGTMGAFAIFFGAMVQCRIRQSSIM